MGDASAHGPASQRCAMRVRHPALRRTAAVGRADARSGSRPLPTGRPEGLRRGHPRTDAGRRNPSRRRQHAHLSLARCLRRGDRRRDPARSRASAPRSPRSSASPRRARSTSRRSCRTGPSSSTTFGDFVEGSYLAHAVYGYFLNGGGNCYVVRIGTRGNGRQAARPAEGSSPPPQQAQHRRLPVTAIARAPNAQADQASRSADAERRDARRRTSSSSSSRVDGKAAEIYDNVTTKRGRPTTSRPRSTPHRSSITLEEVDRGQRAARRSARARSTWSCPSRSRSPPSLDNLGADDYVGDAADRTGFSGLEAVEEVTMVAVPDLMAALEQGAIDLETVKAVQLGDDRALRADGRPHRHPRHAAAS